MPIYIESPEKLVGKHIQHKCVDGNTVVWFGGTVTGIKTVKPDPVKTEFNVIYDEEPEATWFFPLLSDMKKGDLLVDVN